MELEELARKYALRNAVDYGGECDPGAVIGKVMSEDIDADPSEVQEVAAEVAAEVNELTGGEQRQALEHYEFEEEDEERDPIPGLPGAEDGDVVVRFAPNPNGPPTLGSSRGMVINGEFRDRYEGTLVLRFDDTDPRTKRPLEDAYQWYQEDFEWLGYEPDRIVYSSRQFQKYYRHARELIEQGNAYVCRCSPEEGSRYREEGEPCPHRDRTVEENMESWEGMLDGTVDEGEAVLRIKTDMSHKNPAVRDWVAFRIIEDADHPVTGDEYRVWPLLDFASAIEDYYTETTHIVRGKDLRASTKRQEYVYGYLGWEYPEVMYWGRVDMKGLGATMSTSSLAKMIQEGELEGWDDPRAPTVRSFRKRGFQARAIKEFWKEMGVTENDVEASLETLESHNREVVDDDADRYFFVADPVELVIGGVPEEVEPEIPLHPDHPDRGYRRPDLEREGRDVKVFIERSDMEDGFLRLKGLCNIEIEDGEASYVEGDHTVAVERDAPIIHWVPAGAEEAVVVMPDNTRSQGRIEPCSIDSDDVVQFERFGFVRSEDAEENVFYFAHR